MSERIEVDQRETPELEVTVWYVPEHEICILSLVEKLKHRAFEMEVAAEDVADALQHPFYYAAERGLDI